MESRINRTWSLIACGGVTTHKNTVHRIFREKMKYNKLVFYIFKCF